MRHRYAGWIVAFVMLIATPVKSNSSDLKMIGQATATWLWVDVYDAKLYAPSNMPLELWADDSVPLSLQLCYHVGISRDEFIEAAEKGLPEKLSAPQQQAVDGLHASYRNVQEGDCYSLSHQPEKGTELLLNGESLFVSNANGFKAVYFGIWLGDKALSEKVKVSLLGGESL